MNDVIEETDLIRLYTDADLAIDDARNALRRRNPAELHNVRLRIAALRDRCVDRIVADTKRLDHIDAKHEDRRQDRAYRELQRQLAIATETHDDLRDVDAQISEFVVTNTEQDPPKARESVQPPSWRQIATYALGAVAALLGVPFVERLAELAVDVGRDPGVPYAIALAVVAAAAVVACFVFAASAFALNQLRAQRRGSAYAYSSSLILIAVWLAGVLAWLLLGGGESSVTAAATIVRAGGIVAAISGLVVGTWIALKTNPHRPS